MKIPNTLTFPSLNSRQESFLERLSKFRPYGGALFCDEGMYPGNSWIIRMGDFNLDRSTWHTIFSSGEENGALGAEFDGKKLIFISFPELMDLADKKMVSLSSGKWHRIYGNGKVRKSYDLSLTGLAYDFCLWTSFPIWKKTIVWLLYNIKLLSEILEKLLGYLTK
jgi:hypothetical protein